MDINYLRVVLTDFTFKQLSIINRLNNQLNILIPQRHDIILNVLRMNTKEKLKDWTPLKIKQALMAVNDLGFLNECEEKSVDENLTDYLSLKKVPNQIVSPFIDTCCGKQLMMNFGRKVTIFGLNHSYPVMLRYGLCIICQRQYFHNYFIDGKEKFVMPKSINDSCWIYFGGDYGYEVQLMKWLSNSILYLYSGFENFAKCYNETRKQSSDVFDQEQDTLSPTRIQDTWFLYNFVITSFFYMRTEALKIPSSW